MNRIKILIILMIALTINANSQTKKIAFLGQASTYTDNIPNASDGFTYDDDRAAAMWFMDDFVGNHDEIEGHYYSFQDVVEGKDLSEYDVLWIQLDGATWPGRLEEWPRGVTEGSGERHCVISESGFEWNGGSQECISIEDTFIKAVRGFYENGGNIFLGNYAGKALEVLGVFDGLSNPWEYRPNQVFGETVPISDSWAVDNSWGNMFHGEISNPLVSGFDLGEPDVNCNNGIYLEFLSSGQGKKNRTCQYNLDFGRISDDTNSKFGGSATILQKQEEFETTLNAEILFTNCNGNEIQSAQFNPRKTGNGIVIMNGAGSYDWYLGENSVSQNVNVKLFTSNVLMYLSGATLSIEQMSNPEIKIYPNPVLTTLNINYPRKVTSYLYTVLGDVILETNSKQIDIRELKAGIYFLRTKDLNTQNDSVFKIIKK